MKNSINCFKCGSELAYAGPGADRFPRRWYNQPSGGLSFRTYGNYGSTFFDPFRVSAFLEIAVCDACMRAHRDRFVASEGAEGEYD